MLRLFGKECLVQLIFGTKPKYHKANAASRKENFGIGTFKLTLKALLIQFRTVLINVYHVTIIKAYLKVFSFHCQSPSWLHSRFEALFSPRESERGDFGLKLGGILGGEIWL